MIISKQATGPKLYAEELDDSQVCANGVLFHQALDYSATISWDPPMGNIATVTLTGNPTISMERVCPGRFDLIVIQDATGSRTITWSSDFEGTAPTLSTAADSKDIVHLVADGTKMYFAGITNVS